MPARSHYDVLGVRPDASADQIREAFRALARDHHPDRATSAARSRPMTEINEAYRVLSDPGRRAVYDASLRTGAAPAAAPSPAEPMVPPPAPARMPWRALVFFGTIAIVGALVLSLFSDPPAEPRPDGITRIGDCVEVGADGRSGEVACTRDPAVDLVVEDFVGFDGVCPAGTRPYQDRQGMGVACVRHPSG